MGQRFSIKRPKKNSFTWVLREQIQQTQQLNTTSFKWNETNLYTKGSKTRERKSYSEKYSNEKNHVTKKIIDSTKSLNSIRYDGRKCEIFDRSNVHSLSPVNVNAQNKSPSERSIYVTSVYSDNEINRRRRRRKSTKCGYNINNINDFLSKCSLQNPANIPVVMIFFIYQIIIKFFIRFYLMQPSCIKQDRLVKWKLLYPLGWSSIPCLKIKIGSIFKLRTMKRDTLIFMYACH